MAVSHDNLKCIVYQNLPTVTHASKKEIIQEHLSYIQTKMVSQTTWDHFNFYGHFIHDFKVTILEKVHKTDRATRETRESMFIQNFHTELDGINKSKWLRSRTPLGFNLQLEIFKMCVDIVNFVIWTEKDQLLTGRN